MNILKTGRDVAQTGILARFVAEHIRWLRTGAGVPTTPLHLVKLVYISHGWMLGFHGEPLIREEVEAWRHGPVIPSIYHRYKPFGGNHISLPVKSQESHMNQAQLEMVVIVEKEYRELSALRLSAMTHKKGSPWDITVRRRGLVNAIIPTRLIQEHYSALLSS